MPTNGAAETGRTGRQTVPATETIALPSGVFEGKEESGRLIHTDNGSGAVSCL